MTLHWQTMYSKSGMHLSFVRNIQLALVAFFLLPIFSFANTPVADSDVEQAITKVFQEPSVVGEQLTDLPIWPIFKQSKLAGYAFKSVDFVDLRGFSGKPINMLIGINTEGIFQGVKILEHHEPMFTHDLKGAMQLFVDQYSGHKISARVIINNGSNRSPNAGTTSEQQKEIVQFDGISKATISLAVINKSVLSSALHIARSKLAAYKQKQISIAKPNLYKPLSWEQLLEEKLIKKRTITQDRVTRRIGLPLTAYQDPNLDLSDPSANLNLYYGYLNVPMIGRNLLGDKRFEQLMRQLKPEEHAIGVISEGFYTYLNNQTFNPGTEVENIYIEQNNLLISMQALSIDTPKTIQSDRGTINGQKLHIFKIPSQADLTPSDPMSLIFNMVLALPNGKVIEARFKDDYSLSGQLFETITPEEQTETLWIEIWQARIPDIIVLCLSLLLLTVVFIRQQSISKRVKGFHIFRWGFLFFTLFFIGFFAQGQLSVINIYTLLLELAHGFSLEFFLLDPIIFILWTYTAVSLILWGRGLFCGWLCPFGALQEMVSWVAKKLKIKQLKIQPTTNKKLLPIKYLILYILIASAFYSTSLAEKLTEVEPFKTSITFFFIQSWPFVVYALLLLGAGLFIHKFYCRYICPLGAGLAIIGQFRRFEWLNRRSECGTPCQVCRNKCGINAIDRKGEIDYNECIQCLECIVIINNDTQCAPAIVEKKLLTKKAANKHSASPVTFVTPTPETFTLEGISD